MNRNEFLYIYLLLVTRLQGHTFLPDPDPNPLRNLPQGEDDLYKTQDGDFLAGTAEVPIMGFHADEILKAEELPKKYLGFSLLFYIFLEGFSTSKGKNPKIQCCRIF